MQVWYFSSVEIRINMFYLLVYINKYHGSDNKVSYFKSNKLIKPDIGRGELASHTMRHSIVFGNKNLQPRDEPYCLFITAYIEPIENMDLARTLQYCR